jgi:hypothetical protein
MLTKTVSLTKRVYGYASLLATINAVVLIGLAVYLFATGGIDADGLRRAAHALRDESVPTLPAVTAAAPVALPGQTQHESQVDNLAVKAQMDVEILHREAERVKVELAQRLALNKGILVEVQNERDAFRREQELQKRRQEESEKQSRDEGFERQIQIFQTLSPKVAVQHLLAMSDPDEAARILTAIDSDRARKIVEAARRDPELSQMQMILQKVRDAGPMPAIRQEDQ